ncbi:MAG: TonB-dependent receptor [Bacteroidales bacterium]|jgi:outer membrane receptor for ferrienterochelin and colicin|nr:TonB-dependent receptor [Bacteroidales bacterium]
MKNFISILLLTILVHAQVRMYAQTPSDTPADTIAEEKTLQEVSITNSESSSYISSLKTVKTEVITSAGLMQLACCNLAESFENSATVDVGYSDAVSGAKQIQMLGLTGLYSQIMYENMPFFKGLSSIYGFTFVPGPFMDAIQISKGTSSVINGYEALTGQINLEYRKPQTADKLFINFYLNSELQSDLNIISAIPVTKKLSTVIFGHASFFGSRLDHIGKDGFMDKPQNLMVNLLNRWTYEGAKYHSVSTVNGIYNRRVGGQMNFNPKKNADSVWGFTSDIKRIQAFTKNGFMLDDKGTNLGTQISATYTDLSSIYGVKSYNANEINFYANFIFEKYFKEIHKLNVGLSYQWNNIDESYFDRRTFDEILNSVKDYSLQKDEHIPGVFSQYTLTIDKLSVVAGVRYDYNSFYSEHLITPRLHAKWNITDNITLRGSAGRGYRSPNVFAENAGLMASSRVVLFEDNMAMEDAWNYGINYAHCIPLGNDNMLTLSFDAYRTDFVRQLIVDMETPHYLRFYMSDKKSYANSLQAEAKFALFDNIWTLTLAGRYNDVKQTIDGKLVQKALSSPWKGLVVNNIKTRMSKWMFDITTQFNGKSRIPNTNGVMTEYSKPYVIMHAQITKRFKYVDLYAGCENIFNQVQKDPVIAADNPFGNDFDATVIWGSLMGRTFYIGVRFTL